MLRAVDANLDRLGEGLRVLEDVTRFLLDDRELCRQLKFLRHKLVEEIRPMEQQLLAARKARQDVGAFVRSPGGAKHKDLLALVKANARRTQESLRVLEEFARLSSIPRFANATELEQLRFRVYELEQEIISKLLRRDKVNRLAGLYLILDTQNLGGRDAVEVLAGAIRGGIKAVQLRDKQLGKTELLQMARRLRKVCVEKDVLFIVNDYVDVALAAGADGVHLGQGDLPVAEARRLLPLDKLVGLSTTTLSQARRAQSDGADYVAVGSIYPTPSKGNFKLVGPGRLRQIRGKTSLPLIAIGGINIDRIEEVVKAGAHGVAVIGAVLGATDVEKASRGLVTKLEQFLLTE